VAPFNDSELVRREIQLLKLPHLYARALDRCQTDVIRDIFTRDAVFERAGKPTRVYSEICEIPNILASKYHSTFHAVYNQVFEIEKDIAIGEVYCIAHHLSNGPQGHGQSYNLLIRYSDRYEFGADGKWRFQKRRLVVDGEYVTPMIIVDPKLE
jgi:hypothetical protein